jgi:hypothetical protein
MVQANLFQANTGGLDDVISRRTQILGNMSLLQVQGLVLSSLAAMASFSLGKLLAPNPEDYAVNSPNESFRRRWLQHGLSSRSTLVTRGATRPAKLPSGKTKLPESVHVPHAVQILQANLLCVPESQVVSSSCYCNVFGFAQLPNTWLIHVRDNIGLQTLST